MLGAAVGSAGATEAEKLEAKLASARDEASSLSSQLQATTAELGGAEAEAKDAAAEEEELSGLLAEGHERAAELADKLSATRHRLAVEKARLRRSRAVLAERLVAIYESGTPSTADLVFGSGDYEDFVTQSDYLRAISEADSALADRVAEVRAAVHREVLEVADLKAEAIAYDERLEAARAEIAAVREAAQAAAARLESLKAEPRSLAGDAEIRHRRMGRPDPGSAPGRIRSRSRRRSRPLARRPVLDPDLHRDVRVRRQLQRRQPLERGRRRLPDPALDLGTVRRPGRTAERPEGRTGPDRGRNLGRLGRQRLGLRLSHEFSPAAPQRIYDPRATVDNSPRMVASMAVMARETWTDERLDDLNEKAEKGFDEVKGEIRDLRSETKAEFHRLRVETKTEFHRLRVETKTEFRELRAETKTEFGETKTEFRELRAEMNSRFNGIDARFDSLQKTMVLGVVGMSASIIGALIAVSL